MKQARWQTIIPLLIIGAGVILRLWSFYDGRSLFLDEANLALNISELSYVDFFCPLNYQQYAPPFYLIDVKISTLVFGNNEWALRLPALIAGIASLWLFDLLLKEWYTQAPARWITLLLIATSPFIVRYSTELKQYSSDIFFSLLIIYYAIRHPLKQLTNSDFLRWSILGMLCIWYAMPSVFMLTGVGGYYAWSLFKNWDRSNAYKFAGVGVSWLLAFFLLYHFVLDPSLEDAHLLNFHQSYFFPLNFLDPASWNQAWQIIRSLLVPAVGYTALGLGIGIGLLLWGSIRFAKQNLSSLLLIILPILACFLTSAFEKFSLLPRVSLFLIPLFLLLIGKGMDGAFRLLHGKWKILLSILLFIGFSTTIKNITTLGQDTEIEDIKTALKWAKAQNCDSYIHHEAIPAYRYYTAYYKYRHTLQLEAIPVAWDQPLRPLLDANNSDCFVLIHSHLISATSESFQQEWQQIAAEKAKLTTSLRVEGAAGLLFEKE